MATPTANTASSRYLNLSSNACFALVCLGQWLFVVYLLGFYWRYGVVGDFEAWNKVLPHGYEQGNTLGNVFLTLHVVLAAYISCFGVIQLISKLRQKWPRFHRWNGRLYIAVALVMAISGLYLSLSGRKMAGDFSQLMLILINALLIIACAIFTVIRAIQKRFVIHRIWALRLFLCVSGVWLFRLGLMAWFIVMGGPVGINIESFSGPFLTVLAFCVYVLPVFVLELYLRANSAERPAVKYFCSSVMCLICAVLAIGIFGASVGLWLPRL